MPSVLAETLVFECRVPPEVDLKDVSFTIDGVSHLYDSPAPSLAKIGGCHADVSCFDSWHNVAGGVGRITFVEDGNTFICSGGLLQDNTASGPYFLTANHCIGNQSVASTLEVFWLYQTSECQGPSPTLSEVPRTPGGADYVAGSRGNDFALLRLRRVPPPGVVYLSWSAQPPATGEAVATIHHPGGSYKRISLGAKTGADSAFTKVRWSTGVTEPGSSGAPLFNSRQEVVGQLYGGSSSCGNPDGVDSFGKFEITYQTVKTWLHSAEPAPAPPLPIPRGTYMGLFHKADGLSIETSGTLAITTAANRRFTGAIRMSSGSHAFSGVFDASGQASITISRGAWPALRTFLQVDNSDRDRLTGEIAGSGWSSILTANRAVYNGTTQIAPQASRYTLAIPGAGPGDGFAIGSITKAGRTFITGKLPGGPTWSRSGFISKEGEFPLLALMSGGREMLAGWISFGEGYWSSPGGALTWVPQDGSILSLGMSGSRYVAPAPLQPVLEASALSITFSSDGASSTFRIPLGPKRKILVTNDDLSRVSITFNGNGTFSGKVLGGVTDQTASFTGVLLQNVQMGFGAFSGSGSLGTVRLVPE